MNEIKSNSTATVDQEDGTIQRKVNDFFQILNRSPSDTTLSVTKFDICWTMVSIVTRLIGIGLNIAVAINFYRKGQMDYFVWTMCCFLIPMFVTIILQTKMYFDDQQRKVSRNICYHIGFLFFVLLLFRYCQSLYYAICTRNANKENNKAKQKKYYDLLIKTESDLALLKVFECFLETAPQKVLHISIIIISTEPAHVFQILAISNSLINIAWCLASYHRCIRFSQIDKLNMTWIGTMFQWLWHFFITVSRVLSIACLATVFPEWAIIGCAIHTFCMGLWIFAVDRSPFCSHTICHSLIFSLLLGAVFNFNYILPKDRPTRYRYTVYYTICFLENLACIIIFIQYSNEKRRHAEYFIPLCVLAIVAYLIGIVFMILYYVRFHPNILSRRELQITIGNGCDSPKRRDGEEDT